MFSVHCETHGTEVLLTSEDIEALIGDEHGIVLHWRCRCGQRGALRTGRRRTAA